MIEDGLVKLGRFAGLILVEKVIVNYPLAPSIFLI